MAARWLTMNKKYYNKNHPETAEAFISLIFIYCHIFICKMHSTKKNRDFLAPALNPLRS